MLLVLLLIVFNAIILLTFQSHYLFGGDAAEFSLISETWSISHPPGYPFYSILANIFQTFLIFLPSYFRLNILSIFPTIITSVLLNQVIFKLIKNRFISFISALFYVYLFPVWLYSEVPEVFALNNLIIITITYLLLKYNENKNSKIKYLVYFLLGLIVSHHHTAIFFLPGWFLLIQKNIKSFLNNLKISLIIFLLGLTFYLYPVIVSHFTPPLDYENAKTIIGLIRLITRASYGTFRAYVGSSTNFISQLFNSFSLIIYILQDFRVTGLALILIGMIYLNKKNRLFSKFIMTTLIFELFFLFYTSFPTTSSFIQAISERFFIPIYLILIFPFALGLDFLNIKVSIINKKFIHNRIIKKLLNSFIYIFSLFYVLIILYSNYQVIKYVPEMNEFNLLAKNILDSVPKNSILSTGSDTTTFSTYYYYYVKNYRKDIKIVHLGLLGRDYYQQKLKKLYPDFSLSLDKNIPVADFIKKNAEKYNILLENPQETGVWAPYGLLWKYYSDETQLKRDIKNIVRTNNYLWTKHYSIPKISIAEQNILHLKSIRDHYIARLFNFTNLLIIQKDFNQASILLNNVIDDYDKNNTTAIGSLLKIYSLNKKCHEAKKFAKKFVPLLDDRNLEDLTSILYYYNYCDQNEKKIDQYIKLYNKIKKEQQIFLKDI